jgi:hypothetical protein
MSKTGVRHDPVLFFVSPFRCFVEGAFAEGLPIALAPGIGISVHGIPAFTEGSVVAAIPKVVHMHFRYRAQRPEKVYSGILRRVTYSVQFMADLT